MPAEKKFIFKELLTSNFPHKPTSCQNTAIEIIDHFLSTKEDTNVMILKGYAGTGKTTLIKAITEVSDIINKKVILLSPTGRGAKVMTEISKHNAFTIHKHIYKFELKPDGSATFNLAYNKFSNSLFIIDEASMIQGGANKTNENELYINEDGLLYDLFTYITSRENNKIIIIGDPAQLPPVNYLISPALDETYLQLNFRIETVSTTMKNIVRQVQNSGILKNATLIRKNIETEKTEWPQLITEGYQDVIKPDSYETQELITDAFSKRNNDSVVITLSNKMANKYNAFIRSNIFFRENIIDAGDIIMAVKNNYFWLSEEGDEFIANGEMMEIRSVRNIEEKYGLMFADAEVKLIYQKNEPVIEVKILLNTLNLPNPSLPHNQFMELWNNILNEQEGRKTKKLSRKILRENPYINAIQIKFAWALTCHKAQGGQWDNVFLDTEFLMKKEADIGGLRWLYTAFTRAKKRIVLLR